MNASSIDWTAYDYDPEYRKKVYNSQALLGGAVPGGSMIGGKLIKGSAEAKARMAYLRSLRGKKKTGGMSISKEELADIRRIAESKKPGRKNPHPVMHDRLYYFNKAHEIQRGATGAGKMSGHRVVEAPWPEKNEADFVKRAREVIERERRRQRLLRGGKIFRLPPGLEKKQQELFARKFPTIGPGATAYEGGDMPAIPAVPEGVKKVVDASVGNWVDWGKAYQQERDDQIADIVRLENLQKERKKNPKMRREEILTKYNQGRKPKAKQDESFMYRLNNGVAGNILRGPTGWIRLIARKARQNKIDKLKRELGIL